VTESQDVKDQVEQVATEADDKETSLSERVSDVAKTLKPAAETAAQKAESIAAQAVHLGAKGLNKIDAYFGDRKERAATGNGETAADDGVPSAADPPQLPPAD